MLKIKIQKVMYAKRVAVFLFVFTYFAQGAWAQSKIFTEATASVHEDAALQAVDGNIHTGWSLSVSDAQADQSISFVLNDPGTVKELKLSLEGLNPETLKKALQIFITYDPMNLGNPVDYTISGHNPFVLKMDPKYGAHLKLLIKGGVLRQNMTLQEVGISYMPKQSGTAEIKDKPWMNPKLPVNERIKLLLAVMTPAQKMELLREGWGIPGIPALGIPFVNKVEAIHGFSYGSGATIFPQSIAQGATWDKKLIEKMGEVIGDETVSANTAQAWSPVLDVAQDPRWGRMEETYGEDPVLVTDMGGAWIAGIESKGIMVTPKHFAGHGAPLGGRDSHDIGLSEREMREIHLPSFRSAVEKNKVDAVMVAYSTFEGVPDAKSKSLLMDILRDEWGFNGFVVSDCGAINNLTSKKHYTAIDKIEAANQALAVGVATNCGNTYSDPAVIQAAKDGKLNMDNLDFTCSTLLGTMFRNGLFERKPFTKLDWDKIYSGWDSPAHKALAKKVAEESIVLLKNEQQVLPLSKKISSIAVIGPGADDLQPGDYTAKLQPGQLISVLEGIKGSVGANTKINYAKGCSFIGDDSADIEAAVKMARQSDVAVMVLGDCSTSESKQGVKKTSGEANDYASLILRGLQEALLEAVCATGKPVVLILQSGRAYNLSYAAAHCKAIMVNWLPGEQGGPATADVLFGDYNPAGRLPVTFAKSVAQLPLYYNFKPSGRGYNYVDMDFMPLYRFGYGLSYTSFEYSELQTAIQPDGSVKVNVSVKNTGNLKGDEVVQLYVTDMYSSVDTRVMELKDFDRISLAPNETKHVSFTLTPYELSLLNATMDRVVEPGTFKISVGGMSPSFIAADEIKNSVAFKSPTHGLTTTIDYKQSFAADFELKPMGWVQDSITGKPKYSVQVKNSGNITDVGKVTMYLNGHLWGEHHFEISPGANKDVWFDLSKSDLHKGNQMDPKAGDTILFITKYKSTSVKL